VRLVGYLKTKVDHVYRLHFDSLLSTIV